MIYFYFLPMLALLLLFGFVLFFEWWNGNPVRTTDIGVIVSSFIPGVNIFILMFMLIEIAKSDKVIFKGRGK